eukprot:2180498-Rhodomonas_salina.5
MGTADLLRWHRQNMSVCQVVSPPPHIYCKKAGTDMVCSLQSSWAEVPEQDDSDRRDEAGDRCVSDEVWGLEKPRLLISVTGSSVVSSLMDVMQCRALTERTAAGL